MSDTFDVVGIGNAIVDILGLADEKFLEQHSLTKGAMILVDEERSHSIYHQMGQTTECSGGSAANTLAGLSSLGAKTAFIGKVRNDQLGGIFTHDLHGAGVRFVSSPATQGPATANCIICVTSDAQRTMATYLGACGQVSEDDIDAAIISHGNILYIEGYLWDNEPAKAAIRKAISIAKKHGKKVAFTLSDTFCVHRHRDEFAQLMESSIDILFANEQEILAQLLVETIEQATEKLTAMNLIAAITLGEKGSRVVKQSQVENVPAHSIKELVDTTGAGDLFAGGFLFGITRGWALDKCAALGNQCAGHIIQQMGARSMKKLDALVA